MAIPKFRQEGYLDDGVTAYQCLSCYEGFTSSDCLYYRPWKFCPHCGLEWEGEHKWDMDKPRYPKNDPREYVSLEYRVKDEYFEDKPHIKDNEWQDARVGDPVWIMGKRYDWPLEEERRNEVMIRTGERSWKSRPNLSKYTTAKWAMRYGRWLIKTKALDRFFGEALAVEARLVIGSYQGYKRQVVATMDLGRIEVGAEDKPLST